ncbi:MAG: trehalose-6-phosphate synthase [Acidobacteriota bacterium]
MSYRAANTGPTRTPRMVVVSNRRPFTFKQGPDGPMLEKSAGGLVTALYPILELTRGTWVAWDGAEAARGLEGTDSTRTLESASKAAVRFVPVRLTHREVSRYYHGFSNRALWPLSHLFIGRSHFAPSDYREYERVNRKFAEATAEVSSPGDRIWVHDYHLTQVPEGLRAANPNVGPIGYFWHIPFPPWDVFRVLPWKRQVLRGMLGADLIGFHLEDYAEHFRQSVQRCLGLERGDTEIFMADGRRVRVGAFPIGIDVEKIEAVAASKLVRRREKQIRDRHGGRRILLSVDRLDYSKGILERLMAIEYFFERYPEYRGSVDFVQVAVPSRTRVEEYRFTKRHIEEAVGRINGRFTDEGWMPIRYLYRSIPLHHLIAAYRAADVALVTPLRDGMNLVAMEYVASQAEARGALVLSELAGVAGILTGAFQVNPFDCAEVAAAIAEALGKPAPELRRRMEAMREQVREHDIFGWHERFWGALETREPGYTKTAFRALGRK